MKKVFAVGNWKMHKTAKEAADYVRALAPLLGGCSAQVLLAVPFTAIQAAAAAARGTPFAICAQNMHEAAEGAFTGEISGQMLKEAGASFVLLGHSERRSLFGETDEFIHQKMLRALQDDLTPILCVGETLEEREEGLTEKVLKKQIGAALKGLDKRDPFLLAYEPVWAIGTGKTATAQMAAEAQAVCRSAVGPSAPILYGGSVKPENAKEFMRHFDGVLVGGASLSPSTFAQIAIKVVL